MCYLFDTQVNGLSLIDHIFVSDDMCVLFSVRARFNSLLYIILHLNVNKFHFYYFNFLFLMFDRFFIVVPVYVLNTNITFLFISYDSIY